MTALRLGAVSFALNLVMGVFSAVPRALQRFDIINILNVVLGSLQIGGTVALVATGFGLGALVFWSCLLSGLSLATYFIIAKQLLPDLSIRPRFDGRTFRELFGFSSFVMISNFTGVASAHSEKIILGGLAPIAQITYYTVPFNLVSRVLMLIPSNLVNILFPAFAAMSATEDRKTIQRAYARAFRFIFLTVAPISILLIAFGDDVLRLWIGPEMGREGGPVLAVLAAAILINAPAWVCVTVGQSLGRPSLVTAAQVFHLITLVICGLIFVPLYGAFGGAIAWLTGNLVGVPALILLVNRYVLSFNTATMLKETLARPVIAGGVVMIVALAHKPLVHSFTSLLVASTIIIIVYLVMTYFIAFDVHDRSLIRSFISSWRLSLKNIPEVAKERV